MYYKIPKIDKSLAECINIIITKVLVSYATDRMVEVKSLVTKMGSYQFKVL